MAIRSVTRGKRVATESKHKQKMSKASSAIGDLKVRLDSQNRKSKPKILFALGVLQMLCISSGAFFAPTALVTTLVLAGVMAGIFFAEYREMKFKKDTLAPIVNALLEIEEGTDH